MAMYSPKTRETGFFDPAKKMMKKMQDGASTMMAWPMKKFYERSERKANEDTKTLKRARMYDKAPDFDDMGKPTGANMARTEAEMVRMKRKAK